MSIFSKCTHPHYCYEWDNLLITPLEPEYEACICECACDPEFVYKESDWHELNMHEKKVMLKWLAYRRLKDEEKKEQARTEISTINSEMV